MNLFNWPIILWKNLKGATLRKTKILHLLCPGATHITFFTRIPLHCNSFLFNLYCCCVNCSVYTDALPGVLRTVQYSAPPILYCDMYSVLRTLLLTRGLLRTPPLTPLSPSMTTSTTNLVATNHREGKSVWYIIVIFVVFYVVRILNC